MAQNSATALYRSATGFLQELSAETLITVPPDLPAGATSASPFGRPAYWWVDSATKVPGA